MTRKRRRTQGPQQESNSTFNEDSRNREEGLHALTPVTPIDTPYLSCKEFGISLFQKANIDPDGALVDSFLERALNAASAKPGYSNATLDRQVRFVNRLIRRQFINWRKTQTYPLMIAIATRVIKEKKRPFFLEPKDLAHQVICQWGPHSKYLLLPNEKIAALFERCAENALVDLVRKVVGRHSGTPPTGMRRPHIHPLKQDPQDLRSIDLTSEIQHKEDCVQLEFLMDCLEPSTKSILQLWYYSDATIQEIASSLEITKGAVKKRLQRAKEKLYCEWWFYKCVGRIYPRSLPRE